MVVTKMETSEELTGEKIIKYSWILCDSCNIPLSARKHYPVLRDGNVQVYLCHTCVVEERLE